MTPWRFPVMKDDRPKRDDQAKKLETKKLETKFLEDARAGVRGQGLTEEEDLTEQEMSDLGGG